MAKFRLTLIPTLFTIPALIVLVTLGSWQLYRLHWKNALIADIGKAIHLDAAPLPSPIPSPDSLQYRKIILEGEFLHQHEIYLYTGTREYRGEQGYDILTPLKQKNGTIVLVDRGWVPIDNKLPKTRPETLVNGSVKLEGYVLLGEQKKFFTPENDAKHNMWFWIDIPTIASHTTLNLPPFYILQAAGMNPNALPMGRDLTINIRNDHLQYAITWFSAALALLVIYIIYHRKPE